MIEIPLTADPEQNFNIIIGGVNYNVRVLLNSRTGLWTMTLLDGDIILVAGIGLVSGVDILNQYTFLPIKNAYVVNLESPNTDPSKEGLGTVSRLFILTDEEVANG